MAILHQVSIVCMCVCANSLGVAGKVRTFERSMKERVLLSLFLLFVMQPIGRRHATCGAVALCGEIFSPSGEKPKVHAVLGC